MSTLDINRFRNLVNEAVFMAEHHHEGRAANHLREALDLLTPHLQTQIFTGRPEDDPSRSDADRAAWRAARGL